MCDGCNDGDVDRRSALLGSLGLVGVGVIGGMSFSQPAMAQPVRSAASPDEALALLQEGNARYVANQPRQRDFSATRVATSQGQAPFAAILGCADSRVSPELAFDQNPGDLFVVRIAGNFVTDDGLGSLEFGAAVLGTKLILVLGHTSCGAVIAAVQALQKGNDLPGHIKGMVSALKPGIAPALKGDEAGIEARATIENVRYNMARLEKESPILADLISKKQLRVVGGVYDLATGKVTLV